MREMLRLSIEGMHCGACVRRVTDALQTISGVRPDSVEVGSVRMTFDPAEATADQIVATVNRIGFQAYVQK